MYYYSPMMYGNDWGWEVLMMILWLLFFIVIAIVVVRLLNGTRQRVDPLDISKERYAKGELTKEEFEQLKKDLK